MRSQTDKADEIGLTETAYLLSNPADAERLLASIERARRGEFHKRELIDLQII